MNQHSSIPLLPVKAARIERVSSLPEHETGNDVTMAAKHVYPGHGGRVPDVDELVLVPAGQVLVV